MEEDFPRGKTEFNKRSKPNNSIAEPKEKRKKFSENSSKHEFETKRGKKDNSDGLSAVWTDSLSQKTASPNLIACGCISSVFEHELKVELSDGVLITVPIDKVSTEFDRKFQLSRSTDDELSLPRLYTVGQMIIVRIVEQQAVETAKNAKWKTIIGTTEPKDVNESLMLTKMQVGQVLMASVKSVEEKGFLMDIGSPAISGFLSFDKCGDLTPGHCVVGQSLACSISQTPDENSKTRILQLSRTATLAPPVVRRRQLLPGIKLDGVVEKIVGAGVYLKFGEGEIDDDLSFYGFVSSSKLPTPFESAKVTLQVGAKVSCVVTYLASQSPMFGLSARRHLTSSASTWSIKAGVIFGDVQVGHKRRGTCKLVSEKGVGVYFRIDGTTPGQDNEAALFGFCSVNKLEHTTKDNGAAVILPDNYKPDTSKHQLRIIGRSLLSGFLYVSDAPSILNQPIVDVEHAKAGTIVVAKIQRLGERGIFVKLYESINGFLPKLFVDQAIDGKMAKKYPIGSEINARVLYPEVSKNRLVLTSRQAQIKSSKKSVLSSYDQKFVGTIHDGVIVHAADRGLLLAFYNRVKGYLDLTTVSQEVSGSSFYVGQVLSVKVYSVNVEQKRMSVSLANQVSRQTGQTRVVDADSDNDIESATPAPSSDSKIVTMPDSFNVCVDGVTKFGLWVATLEPAPPMSGMIPACHLTDNVGHWDLLAASYQLGDKIGPCVVFAPGAPAIFSAKPAIVQAVLEKTSPTKFDQLEEKKLVVGVVSRIHNDLGYFVDFACNFGVDRLPSGLAPAAFVDKSSDGQAPIVGQTVIGRITKVDVEQRRFRLSLKVADCTPEKGLLGSAMDLLDSCLKEQQHVRDWIGKYAPEQDPRRQLLQDGVQVGQVVDCCVDAVTEFGLVCSLGSGLKGVAVVEHLGKPINQYTENAKIQAVVIRQDLENCCLELNTDKQLIVSQTKLTPSKRQKIVETLKNGQKVAAKLILNKPDSILVQLSDQGHGLLAYMPGKLHMNDINEHTRRQVGQRLKVLVKRKLEDNTVLVLDFENEELYMKRNKLVTVDDSGKLILNTLKNIASVQLGKIYTATIADRDNLYLNLVINKSQMARIHVSELNDSFKNGENVFENPIYAKNQRIDVKIMEFSSCKKNEKVKIAECTAKPSKLACRNNKRRNLGYKREFKNGENVAVFVDSILNEKCTFIINPEWKGHATSFNLSDDIEILNNLTAHFVKDRVFNAKVISMHSNGKTVNLSLSNLNHNKSTPIVAQFCKCQVSSIENGHRILFKMADGHKGICYFTDICGNFDNVLTFVSNLKIGQFLRVYVEKLLKPNKWLLNMRYEQLSESSSIDNAVQDLSKIIAGQKLCGFVRKSMNKGCLITLGPSVYTRMPYESPLTCLDEPQHQKVGNVVCVEVTSIDRQHGKCFVKFLSNKSKITESPNVEKPILSIGNKSPNHAKRQRIDSSNQCLTVAGGFDWSPEKFSIKNLIEVGLSVDDDGNKATRATYSDNCDDDSGWGSDSSVDDDKDDNVKKKICKNKRKRGAETTGAKMSEHQLLQKELDLLNPDRPLQTDDDFDRLLMGNPNSSQIWLRYMALFVQSGEIPKSRLVAERALKTIDSRHEEDKFNIWTAMLNLENTYGTDESLQKNFERARQVCDQEKIYNQLLKIYHRSNKSQSADELVEEMLKKFKSQFDIWTTAGEHFYAHEPKRPEKARELIKRASNTFLKSLPTNPEEKRVDLASRFAQMEFKHGDTELAKTMFEGLLNQYPKRMDLWSVYADMVGKYRNVNEARVIFERATSLKLPLQKIKSFYTKWIDFERRNGNADMLKQVEERVEALDNKLGGQST